MVVFLLPDEKKQCGFILQQNNVVLVKLFKKRFGLYTEQEIILGFQIRFWVSFAQIPKIPIPRDTFAHPLYY